MKWIRRGHDAVCDSRSCGECRNITDGRSLLTAAGIDALRCVTVVLFALVFPAVSAAQTEQVDLELVLLVDASNSIDKAETRFQRQGYAAALIHPDVLGAIKAGPFGRVAVSFMEWADEDNQDIVVPWTVIDGLEAARALNDKLLSAPRMTYGSNAIGDAIAAAQSYIRTNPFDGVRKVIDFSGDSANNWGGISIEEARDNALAAGTIINGLAIKCLDTDCGGRPVSYDLEEAFKTRIIGGPGSFVITVDSGQRFAEAVRRKLILELSDAGTADRFVERASSGFPGKLVHVIHGAPR